MLRCADLLLHIGIGFYAHAFGGVDVFGGIAIIGVGHELVGNGFFKAVHRLRVLLLVLVGRDGFLRQLIARLLSGVVVAAEGLHIRGLQSPASCVAAVKHLVFRAHKGDRGVAFI